MNTSSSLNTLEQTIPAEAVKADLARALRKLDINRRYLAAQQKMVPGNFDPACFEEMQQVLRDSQQLLSEFPLTFPLITPESIQYRIAEAQYRLGDAYNATRDQAVSEHWYRAAIRSYQKIGMMPLANECLVRIAQGRLYFEGTIDDETRRLLPALRALSDDTFAHLRLMMEIAQLHARAGDDYEAARFLDAAEDGLERLYPLPTDDEFQAAFRKFNQQMNDTEEDTRLLQEFTEQARLELLEKGYPEPTAQELSIIGMEYFNRRLNAQPGSLGVFGQQLVHLVDICAAYNILYLAQANRYVRVDDEKVLKYLKKTERTKMLKHLKNADITSVDDNARSTEEIQRQITASLDTKPDIIQVVIERLAVSAENRLRPENVPRSDLMQRAVALMEDAKQTTVPDMIAIAQITFAEVLQKSDSNEEAIRALDEALRVLRTGGNARIYDVQVYALVMLAEIYARREHWQAVDTICEEGIRIVEGYRNKVTAPYLQSAYLKNRISLYTQGAIAALALGNIERMFLRMELSKARLLLRFLQEAVTSPETVRLEKSFQAICRRLDRLDARPASTVQKMRSALIEQRRQVFNQWFIARYTPSGQDSSLPFSLAGVQSSLAADEALIYYYWCGPQQLIIATLDKTRWHIDYRNLLPSQAQALHDFAHFVLRYRTGSTRSGLNQIEAFSEVLLPTHPTAIQILTGKQRLIVSPHRHLHTVPFHALFWQGRRLLETLAVSYAPNLHCLQHRYVAATAQGVLAVGVKQFHWPDTPPLPQAGLEARTIADIYETHSEPALLFLDQEATEDRICQQFTAEASLPFRCLHFATHGINVDADNPLESYLLLQNSRLDGLNIATWKLRTDTVVLSACCSGQRAAYGRGMSELPGDEMFGLQAAFFAAGAKRLVGSLWPADDYSASAIMTAFHRGFARGMLPEIALQQAMCSFLQNASLKQRQVFYWAPFFLSVMGRPIQTEEDLKHGPANNPTI